MDDVTDRFALPLIQPGQAQKEAFHNEAILGLELRLQIVVQAGPSDAPPVDPTPGMAWIVGAAPAEPWAGQAHAIAGWTAAGWRFAAPVPGMLAWLAAAQHWLLWDGTAWQDGTLPVSRITVGGVQVVGEQQPPITTPTGGGTVDANARNALASILGALRAHGLIGI
jgi:hypothetical protein